MPLKVVRSCGFVCALSGPVTATRRASARAAGRFKSTGDSNPSSSQSALVVVGHREPAFNRPPLLHKLCPDAINLYVQ